MSTYVISENVKYMCTKGQSQKNLCRLVANDSVVFPLKSSKRGAGIDQTGSFEDRYVTLAGCYTNEDCRVEEKNCVGYDVLGRQWTNIGECLQLNEKLDTEPFCLSNGKCTKRKFLKPWGLEEGESRTDCQIPADCSPQNGKACFTSVGTTMQIFPCPATDVSRDKYNQCLEGSCVFNESF